MIRSVRHDRSAASLILEFFARTATALVAAVEGSRLRWHFGHGSSLRWKANSPPLCECVDADNGNGSDAGLVRRCDRSEIV